MKTAELVGVILESLYSTWESVQESSDNRPSFEGRKAPAPCLHQYASSREETWIEDHAPEELVEWLNSLPIGAFVVSKSDSLDACMGDREGTRHITSGWVKHSQDSFVAQVTDEFVGYQDK